MFTNDRYLRKTNLASIFKFIRYTFFKEITYCVIIRFNVEDLGIWIDPIDGTNNYIRGKDEIDALKIETDEVVAKGTVIQNPKFNLEILPWFHSKHIVMPCPSSFLPRLKIMV